MLLLLLLLCSAVRFFRGLFLQTTVEEEQAESAQTTQALAEEMKAITHESMQDDPKVDVESSYAVVHVPTSLQICMVDCHTNRGPFS